MLTIRVWDDKKTWDRYTVEIADEEDIAYFGMSVNATSPDGFNQYIGDHVETDNCGKEVINLYDLPTEVKKAISQRLFS